MNLSTFFSQFPGFPLFLCFAETKKQVFFLFSSLVQYKGLCKHYSRRTGTVPVNKLPVPYTGIAWLDQAILARSGYHAAFTPINRPFGFGFYDPNFLYR